LRKSFVFDHNLCFAVPRSVRLRASPLDERWLTELADNALRNQIIMAVFSAIVANSSLDVVIPTTSLGFPTGVADGAGWLAKLKSEEIEREMSFFGA
jgi:hypothetical protein